MRSRPVLIVILGVSFAGRGLHLSVTMAVEGKISRASRLAICLEIKRESEMAIRRAFVHPTPRKLILGDARRRGRLTIYSQWVARADRFRPASCLAARTRRAAKKSKIVTRALC
jgi:hypothetical protein